MLVIHSAVQVGQWGFGDGCKLGVYIWDAIYYQHEAMSLCDPQGTARRWGRGERITPWSLQAKEFEERKKRE